MKQSRSRILTTAAALVSLGLAAAVVSCTGPQTEKAKPGSKTTGPAVAKGDKTTAKPGVTAKADPAKPAAAKPAAPKPEPAKPAPTAAKPQPAKPAAPKVEPGKAPAPPAPVARGADEPVVPPKPGAPLPPPTKPRPVTPEKPTTAGKPEPAKPVPTKPAPTKPEPAKPEPTKPVAAKPEPAKPAPTKPEPAKPEPTKPVAAKPEPTKPAPGPAKPQPKKPEPTKPAVAKPEPAPVAVSEADKILKQRQEELRVERQKNAILVEDYINHASASARVAQWDDVVMWASKALELDHNNERAASLLRQAREAQGYRDAEIASLSELVSKTKSVRREQARFSAQQYWKAAMDAKSQEDYAAALNNLELALTVIDNDPSGVNWDSMPQDIRSQIDAVTKLKAAADATERAASARAAYRTVKEEEARARLADVEKRNGLFTKAMEHFEAERFDKAEELLDRYLEVSPGDRNAQQLKNTANRAKHNRASEDTLRRQREQFAEWRLEMKETTVPYHKILNWPSQAHWDRITLLRKDAGEITKVEPDSPETAATHNRLRTERTSFDFQGEQFMKVIDFIKTTRGLNIVVAADVQPDLEAVPITLKLQDVTVESALETLNRIAGGLTYVVDGSVILITKPELARGEPIVQVHSVGDLTVALTNFIAPNLQLIPAGAEEDEENPRFGGASEGVTPFGGAEELITLVQNNVANEEYWSSEGVSAAPAGNDKLVIVAEPKIQKEVAGFLNDLRGFAGIVVTIETRFLTVSDNFLQDVGVDIRGLGNATPGTLALLDDVTNGLINNASAGFDNGGVGLPANASGRPSSGAFFNNNSDGDFRARTENVFDRALGTNITNVGGALIQYTLVDDTNISLLLKAVQKTKQGRVLQAPSVTVYNTQRANITLINQLTYIQDFDVEVAQTAFIADPIIGIIQDGLVLDVQPTVSHDRKYITLQLKPTIATLVRPIPTFTTSLGAFTTPVTIQIPELEVQRAATTVRVPDGGTLLMGGLKNIALTDLKSETPWFSSLPFASFFMGRKGSAKEMENLMVIVKATISDLQEQLEHYRR